MFWDDPEPLQHDLGALDDNRDNPHVRLPTELRGYTQSHLNPCPQSGVYVPAFSDPRIEAIHAQIRDAETMQALGRLRLVHSAYRKRVFLLSNLPVEVPVDQLLAFDDLMPDRLELELIRKGNIPLTPLGLMKMRPDLAKTRDQARWLLNASSLALPSNGVAALPTLWRSMLLLVEFQAGDARRRTHSHLFAGRNMSSDGIAMVGKVPSTKEIEQLLVEGDPEIEGSGWGKIDSIKTSFVHAGEVWTHTRQELEDDDEGKDETR